MDAMVERIERLERSVRRFRWAGGAVACLGVVGLVMAQKAVPDDKHKVLEVDKIVAKEVVSEDYRLVKGHKTLGEWDSTENVTSFTMFSPSEESIGLILMAGSQSAIVQLWESEDTRSTWFLSKGGTATIQLKKVGSKNVGGIWRSSTEKGTSIVLNDNEGINRAVLGRSRTVTPATGVEHQRPESSLVLYDENGTVLHQVP